MIGSGGGEGGKRSIIGDLYIIVEQDNACITFTHHTPYAQHTCICTLHHIHNIVTYCNKPLSCYDCFIPWGGEKKVVLICSILGPSRTMTNNKSTNGGRSDLVFDFLKQGNCSVHTNVTLVHLRIIIATCTLDFAKITIRRVVMYSLKHIKGRKSIPYIIPLYQPSAMYSHVRVASICNTNGLVATVTRMLCQEVAQVFLPSKIAH